MKFVIFCTILQFVDKFKIRKRLFKKDPNCDIDIRCHDENLNNIYKVQSRTNIKRYVKQT